VHHLVYLFHRSHFIHPFTEKQKPKQTTLKNTSNHTQKKKKKKKEEMSNNSESVHAWAALEAKAPVVEWSFTPRELQNDEVEIKVTHCGLCHTDVSQIDNDWSASTYPMVPGTFSFSFSFPLFLSSLHFLSLFSLLVVGCFYLFSSCSSRTFP
jgi:hypothetical protein